MSKNSQSFIAYYNQFKDKIYNYLLYRTGFNREVAEDLTSEIFVKAFKSFSSFNEEKQFQAWIFTIARNHLINHYRSSKQTIPLEEVENILITKPDNLDQSLEFNKIIKVIGKMNESDREPLLMRYVDDLSSQEIAKLLHKEDGAIRTQISRSLVKLRNILIN